MKETGFGLIAALIDRRTFVSYVFIIPVRVEITRAPLVVIKNEIHWNCLVICWVLKHTAEESQYVLVLVKWVVSRAESESLISIQRFYVETDTHADDETPYPAGRL